MLRVVTVTMSYSGLASAEWSRRWSLKLLTKPKNDCNYFSELGLLKEIVLSIHFLDCIESDEQFFSVEGHILFPTMLEYHCYVTYKCVISVTKHERIVNIYLANVI